MRELALIICLFFLNACSVGMAMYGKENKDTSILFPGSPRQVVIAKLGPPETTTTNENGERIDTYFITKGNAPSSGRAAAHAGMDLLTLGAWEFIGTPWEIGAGQSKSGRWIITYDKDDKIKDIQKIEGAGSLDTD